MNFAAFVLRISKVTERFPRFHKLARRAYCFVRPGIRFQTEAAFKDYQPDAAAPKAEENRSQIEDLREAAAAHQGAARTTVCG